MWFVRLCQLLTGQPMLAAVLVLLSSTPCSPGTAPGGETDADVGTTGLFRSEPAASGAARTGMVFDGAWRWWSTSSSRALCLRQGECREASLARAQAPVSGTGPLAVPAGRHQDLIRHTWTTHR